MDRWQNRVAVVTGASSGIGSAIVQDLVQAGLVVVGLARRKERIDALRDELPANLQSRMHAIRCDVSDQQSVNEAFDWVIKNLGGVDILVNNAGILPSGQILTMDVEQIQQVLQTNVMGVVYCTQRAYASMKQRNFDGHILIVNSVLGHRIFSAPKSSLPMLNIYPSSKYALTAMTEVLRQELSALGTKIKITSISPGLVDTDILIGNLTSMATLRSVDISAGILYAISTPPDVQVHELTIKPLGETI